MVTEVVALLTALGIDNPETGNAAVFDLARQSGAQLQPLHPNVADQELRRYFVVKMEDAQEAEKLAKQLRDLPQVEAAYVKPAGELPNF